MIKWHYAANNDALRTEAGKKHGGRIQVDGWQGLAVSGPSAELPAGRWVARVVFDGRCSGRVRMELVADGKVLAAQLFNLATQLSPVLELGCDLASDGAVCEVRVRCFGRVRADISVVEFDVARSTAEPLLAERQVGYESRKTYAEKIANGFFEKYLSGPAVLEVGYRGYESGNVPIVPQAIGLDVGYPGYDGEHFPFADNSFDGIYSSHCFEHIGPWKAVLQDWFRILKPGGFLVIVVPHQFLFERKLTLPSPINPDHKRFYTAGSLLGEIEQSFEPNSFRIRHLVENDKGFDYDLLPYQATDGCYEIELVVEKIDKPFWHPDDGSVRPYGAGEFFLKPAVTRLDPWEVQLDISNATECMVWGPYIGLGASDYEVDFHFTIDDEIRNHRPAMLVDVGEFGEQLAKQWVEGEAMDRLIETGKVTVPFTNRTNGQIFEFRVWAPRQGSPAKPRYKGVVLRYAGR